MSGEQYNSPENSSPENRRLDLHFVVHPSGEILLVRAVNLGGSLQAVDVVDQLLPQTWVSAQFLRLLEVTMYGDSLS
jgi:hypothetical protein